VPDEHPAIAAAEQIVRAYHDEMLRSAMLYQIREYKQELDGLAADAPADIWAIAGQPEDPGGAVPADMGREAC
jgi:hypothetical protein